MGAAAVEATVMTEATGAEATEGIRRTMAPTRGLPIVAVE
jgi:hypothetical protein